jgi:hypothetical protein
MQPSGTLATLRPDLSGSMMEFDLEADRKGFIALMVMPVIEVNLASDTFGRIALEELLKTASTERGPYGHYPRDKFRFDDESYATKEHGHEVPIDDNLARKYRHYFDAETVATQRCRDRVLRNQEIRVAGKLFDTAYYTGSKKTTAGVAWDVWATSNPIADVEEAVRAVWTRTGVWPNSIAMSRHAFRDCRNSANVIDRIVASGAGNPAKAKDVTKEMLAAVFDLENVFVAGGAKNAANEKQTRSISSLWSTSYASVFVRGESNDIEEPCFGRTFHWSEDGSQIGGAVETYRDETVRGDVVRCRMQTDEKRIYPEMAQLIDGLVTP